MSTVNQAKLDAVNKSFNVLFKNALRETADRRLMNRLAQIVDSNTSVESYLLSSDFVKMRQWIGERRLADIKFEDFLIPNLTYEATLRVRRTDIEDDNVGAYEGHIQEMPLAYDRKQRSDFVGLLTNGTTDNGYDGVPFFSATHPNDTGSDQANLRTGSALDSANLDAAIQDMELLKDNDGEYLDIKPDLLVVSPALRATARDLFDVARLGSGADNPHFESMEWTVERHLGTSTDWYLFDTSRFLKAFIVQDRVAPEFESITQPDSDFVFLNDAFLYGIRARYGMGYGFWQLAQKNEA